MNRERALILGLLIPAACADRAPEPEVPAIESSAQELGQFSSATRRGTHVFGSGSSAQNANYRTRVVVGPEVPVGVAQNSNFKVALGPVLPPPAPIQSTVTPRRQPERIDYGFTSTGQLQWTLSLQLVESGSCGRLVYRRTAMNAPSMSGTFAGLSPGASYCYTAVANGIGGTVRSTGTVAMPALPRLTAGPSFTNNGLAVDVAGTASEAVSSRIEYASEGCVGRSAGLTTGGGVHAATALRFDGNDSARVPGMRMPRTAITVAAWVAPTNDSADVYRISPNLSLGLAFTRNPAFALTTSANTGAVFSLVSAPNDRYSHVVGTWDGSIIRLYVDGVNRGQSPLTGTLDETPALAEIGVNLQGRIAGIAIYDRALSSTEVTAQLNAGPHAELGTESGVRAAYHFAELAAWQSIYDASGNHYAGVLGADHTVESSDPAPEPSFASTVALGTNATALAGTLTSFSGAPPHCYRVIGTAGAVSFVTSPLADFTRLVDTSPPTVVVNRPNVVVECQGPTRTLNLADLGGAPTVMDNFDPAPTVEARLNAQAGPVVSFPYAFPFGSTTLFWRATDTSGNIGYSSPNQLVRVLDTLAPTLVGGPRVSVEATSPSGTPFNVLPETLDDACDPSVVLTRTPSGPFAIGERPIMMTAVDASGNRSEAQRTLAVVDTTPPVFDPPLADLLLGHPGGCFNFAPPDPAVRDNGYTADRLTITWSRISGPGMPACWNLGEHVVRWTVRDPSNNTLTGEQTVFLQAGTLVLTARPLEVPMVASPTAGRFYRENVTVVFDVSNGTPPYQVTVSPTPASLTNTGSTFRALYTAEGSYPSILVQARDGNGSGSNVGSAALLGFGIDRTPPIVDPALVSQLGVAINDPTTFPYLFAGESLDLRTIKARDGDADLEALGTALAFDGDALVTIPHRSALAPATSLSIELWFRVGGFAAATLLAKARTDGDGIGYRLSTTANGRVQFGLRAGGTEYVVSSAALSTGAWHHVAATYDGAMMRLYVDSEPAAYRLATGAIDAGTQPLLLGAELVTGTRRAFLTGELAGVTLWDRAITATEIGAHFNGGVGAGITPEAGTIARYDFADTGQTVSDVGPNAVHGQLGTSNAPELADPARRSLEHPLTASSSGLVRLVASAAQVGAPRTSAMIIANVPASGTPLARGPRQIGGQLCNAPVGGVCNAGESGLRGTALGLWTGSPNADFVLTLEATDAAGNTARREVGLRVRNYVGAINDTIAAIDRLNMDPLNATIQQLSDARVELTVAGSYANLSMPYLEGSYQRADRGLGLIRDAADQAVNVGTMLEDLGRALASNVDIDVSRLGANLHPSDVPIHADAAALMALAPFERRDGLQLSALARSAYEEVAILWEPYAAVRTEIRTIGAAWNTGLQRFSTGQVDSDGLRNDLVRFIRIRSLVGQTRAILSDTVYPMVNAILANQFTNDRRTLREILDVIDKESNDPTEAADLAGITNPLIQDACLDLLANLNLDDERFTRCYLRLNDLARFFDTVSEPLVPTLRLRAGIAIALFNMLEISLFVGPEGVPWVASPGLTVPDLVLPDAIAATVNGSRPLSAVDRDGLLARAYERHGASKRLLDQGLVDAAFDIFVAERCLLLSIYNRYYSAQNPTPNVADPKEPALVPSMFTCP